jgi:N utilization substance protein A
MTPEQLEAIEGIGPKTVEKISLAVNNYFATLEGGENAVALAEGETEEVPSEEAVSETAAEEAPAEGEIQEVAAAADESEASAEEAAAQTEGGEKDVSAEPKE